MQPDSTTAASPITIPYAISRISLVREEGSDLHLPTNVTFIPRASKNTQCPNSNPTRTGEVTFSFLNTCGATRLIRGPRWPLAPPRLRRRPGKMADGKGPDGVRLPASLNQHDFGTVPLAAALLA